MEPFKYYYQTEYFRKEGGGLPAPPPFGEFLLSKEVAEIVGTHPHPLEELAQSSV